MKTVVTVLALMTMLGATAAQARPHHHRHQVCHWQHHHKVCHWR